VILLLWDGKNRETYKGKVVIWWNPISSTEVQIALVGTADSVRYVAIGWNKKLSMVDTEAVLGGVTDAGELFLETYDIVNKSYIGCKPVAEKLTVKPICGTRVGSNTTVIFSRTFDSGRFPLGYLGSFTLTAYGAKPALTKHSVTPRTENSGVFNFRTGGAFFQLQIPDIHAILMVVAFAFLFPVGILTWRYGRNLPKEAGFTVHRVVNTIGFLCAGGGFGLGFYMTHPDHFTSVPHSYFAIVLMVLVVVQIIGGVARPHKDPSSVSMARLVFQRVHAWGGRGTIALAIAQLFIGMHVREYPAYYSYILLAYLAIVLVFVITPMEVKRCLNQRNDPHNTRVPSYSPLQDDLDDLK